ncbi:glycosyltransferase family 1 protein [Persicimonas caeni]|uniref:Glycosyltransferase family 1 protein n=1 Tax=Persicimonas caeni TaxID=2292766 RepID=A0A4Y6PVW5_PERCE|nr:alpha-glucan family phosphorylase [Persicimonas caeni]QDG52448.1 glycosyltransferase family 1 protein [Persicimonas caeni]QED33670.1 glycosyltransferase family 1 protein [Persicimonas caeni]
MADNRFPLVQKLEEIAQNLWWCWQPDGWLVFRDLDPELWHKTNHNPIAFLDALSPKEIEDRAQRTAVASRIQNAHRKLRDYVDKSGPKACMSAGTLHTKPVAYFCAEFGIHESFPIYSGGLGILAGDHMKASSDLGIPIVGVGLFYPLGYFQQSIDSNGWQQEEYGRTDIETLPLTKVKNEDGRPVTIEVEVGQGTIKSHIWRAPVGRNQLLMLDSDVPGNNPEDRQLTSQLYGGDQRMRIRQEILLGIGGVRALEALDITPGVYHLNEGHSAFATFELARRYMEREELFFDEARDKVMRQTVFTTHTPVPAGHDRFPIQLFEDMLGWMRPKLKLDHRQFHGYGRIDLDDPNEPFCMTVLALKMSRYRNGVSNLHGEVSRRMWKDLWPEREVKDVPIGHITNGVHVNSFLAPEMRGLYDKYLEPGWENRLATREGWAGLGNLEPGELWETHQLLKSKLIDFINERVQNQKAPSGDKEGQVTPGSGFDQETLTIGFARRFATYKRADLLMRDMERFKKLINDAERPVQLVFAGKAHPADEYGKALIQKIVKATTDPVFEGRIVFLTDYDMNIARHMLQGVDVWLNNPRRPQEACGTSGQKVVLNGALNCSILDGWWAEAYDGRNGFAIGNGTEYADPGKQDAHDAKELYKVLENEVIPLYYDKDQTGMPREWIERVKWSIISLGWRFCASRMLLDYLNHAYLPASGATSAEM